MPVSPPNIVEGEVKFQVSAAGKPCKTWCRVVGDLLSPTSRHPLVALHGGPGFNHGYLFILSDLKKAHGIPLILYDQIGNGNSTHLPEKKGDLFRDELDNILRHLKVEENYDLLTHSWGGMLVSRHASKQPLGLKYLVLASAPADMGLWVECQKALRTELPQDVQDVLNKHEQDESMDSAEYKAAMEVFYSRFLCRTHPLPEPLAEGFDWIEKDPTVYFTIDAHKINVPNLLFCPSTLLRLEAREYLATHFNEAV
ncbi:proline iminopeptidase [Mycena olivaceomarginata]|nr:proline iminopeptidase [Mycena olivaceomarginata]